MGDYVLLTIFKKLNDIEAYPGITHIAEKRAHFPGWVIKDDMMSPDFFFKELFFSCIIPAVEPYVCLLIVFIFPERVQEVY